MTTDWAHWFQYQLQASADGFAWGFSQVPASLRDQIPIDPQYLGTWPPLRHVWHVTEYERCLALPGMQQWLGAPLQPGDAWQDDDPAWAAVADKRPAALVAAFRAVRQEQVELLAKLAGADWEAPRETLWGPRPLSWIVTKTFQHTYEHGDTLLRMGLWWQHILKEIAKANKENRTG
jgi:hypothetical protein